MIKRIASVAILIALSGCATHQQNAALSGAIIGGIIGASIATPPPTYYYAPVYVAPPAYRVQPPYYYKHRPHR